MNTEITLERFEELLKAEVKLNIIKDMCEAGEYISITEVKRIVGAGENKND